MVTDAESTSPDPGPVDTADPSESAAVQRRHLRGSTLMVGGRLLAMALNMVVQVLTVPRS